MKKVNVMRGVGKAKYVVNFHDGVKKHDDGSEFYDMRIFSNQKDTDEFVKSLMLDGFTA